MSESENEHAEQNTVKPKFTVFYLLCRRCFAMFSHENIVNSDKPYIGQTYIRIQVRREEHNNAAKKNEKNVAQHTFNSGHQIDFENDTPKDYQTSWKLNWTKSQILHANNLKKQKRF